MVEDRITDGKRIAQLLASELSGRETGPLATVSVSDADTDAVPTADGTPAYTIRVGGEPAGRVILYPDRAAMRVGLDDGSTVRESARKSGMDVRTDGDVVVVAVESGATVKRAVDALVAGVDASDG